MPSLGSWPDHPYRVGTLLAGSWLWLNCHKLENTTVCFMKLTIVLQAKMWAKKQPRLLLAYGNRHLSYTTPLPYNNTCTHTSNGWETAFCLQTLYILIEWRITMCKITHVHQPSYKVSTKESSEPSMAWLISPGKTCKPPTNVTYLQENLRQDSFNTRVMWVSI